MSYGQWYVSVNDETGRPIQVWEERPTHLEDHPGLAVVAVQARGLRAVDELRELAAERDLLLAAMRRIADPAERDAICDPELAREIAVACLDERAALTLRAGGPR